jgi:hypothetical protein
MMNVPNPLIIDGPINQPKKPKIQPIIILKSDVKKIN